MKKKGNGRKAFWYVVGGIVGGILLINFIIFLYTTTTFLPTYDAAGNFLIIPWIIRKILYLISFVGLIVCSILIDEGYTYLERH